MAVLLDGLPDGARSKTPRGEVPWGMPEELLAQLIEEVSVLVAQRAREEPLHVTRPHSIEKAHEAAREAAKKAQAQSTAPTYGADGSVKAFGHRQMLEMMKGRVNQ